MTEILKLQDLPLQGKKVLVRVDFNVPLSPDGTITDDTRIQAAIPTIEWILDKGGTVILMSHLGRPKGKKDPTLSLASIAKHLSELLHKEVLMATDSIGEEVEQISAALPPSSILLLENLRFYEAEEKPEIDPSFAEKLAKLGDFYVNDAFGTAHRAHSSTATITQYFPNKAAAGLLLQKEIDFLGKSFSDPPQPFYAIIGGAKISSKLGVLHSLLSKVDALFIGGGMAYTFFKARGIPIGDSLCEESLMPKALDFLKSAEEKNIPLYFPEDLVISDAFDKDANQQVITSSSGIPDGWEGMDIGPKTRELWGEKLQAAKMVFWNGPLGVFEFPRFANGTQAIAKTLSTLNAITIVGGGDSVAAINQLGLSQKFSHISTGGGACLEYIEFGHLPGLDALSKGTSQ
ncbi:MAG: Phosphoglycerate kinase [Chlamydiae bacterium]|nr:Phosphoglycerate kinase [Chlamydiota bacterium]